MKICKDCGETKDDSEYYGVQRDCKDCFKKRVRSQKDRLGVKRNCATCGVQFKALKAEIARGGAITCSRKCFYERLSKVLTIKNENMAMTYDSVHRWIKRIAGKPNHCENCNRSDEATYDWANVSGSYKRDRTDWLRLCRSCHIKFDNTAETRKMTMMRKYGHIGPNRFKKAR